MPFNKEEDMPISKFLLFSATLIVGIVIVGIAACISKLMDLLIKIGKWRKA